MEPDEQDYTVVQVAGLPPLPPKWPTPVQAADWFAEHAGGHAYGLDGHCANRPCRAHFLDATGPCPGNQR